MNLKNLVSRILSKVGDSIKHTTRALVLSAAIIASAVALDYNTKSARGATRDLDSSYNTVAEVNDFFSTFTHSKDLVDTSK